MSENIFELKNVSKWFGEGDNKTEVLTNINLTIKEGEFLAIVGFTGSGKTTLLNLLSGLEMPSEGEVLYKGEPVKGPSLERGVIFQNYSLLPWLNVFQNIELAVKVMFPHWTKDQTEEHILNFIEMVNLTDARSKYPKELSGGMRQRVSVARVLATQPDLLLMDEPLGALDALTRGNLQDEILTIWGANKTTALLITNDVDEGIYMADRIIPLNPGPNATLGPEFTINISRPRIKRELNTNESFISVRTEILKYLVALSESAKLKTRDDFHLPELMPIMRKKRTFFNPSLAS